MELTPVPGYEGAFVRPLTARMFIDLRRDTLALAKTGADNEGATVLAAAFHAGCTSDGVPLWESLDAVQADADPFRVIAVGQLAVERMPERRDPGN